MAEETKVGMKLEEEAKPIKKMCEKLMDIVNNELDKGIENVDTKELGEAIDMIKDLYKAKKEMYEACYYKGVLEAMEQEDFADEGEIEEKGRKGYRSRDSRGRFMSRRNRRGYEIPMMMYDEDWEEMQRLRDIDKPYGKMGYVDGETSKSGAQNGQYSSRNQRAEMSQSNYDKARRGYEETRAMHNGNTVEDKQHKMKSLEDYTKELAEDITDMVRDMSVEEKNLLRTKLQTLAQKVQ